MKALPFCFVMFEEALLRISFWMSSDFVHRKEIQHILEGDHTRTICFFGITLTNAEINASRIKKIILKFSSHVSRVLKLN